VVALAFLMAVTLLIYTLAERKIRQTLEQTGETVLDQRKSPTMIPTCRWIMQKFQGIHLVLLNSVPQITNLTRGMPNHKTLGAASCSILPCSSQRNLGWSIFSPKTYCRFLRLSDSMKQTRIIILTEIFYPEKTSTGYYLTKIAEGLAHHHDVHVICGPATEDFKRVQAPSLEFINGITIQRCLGTAFNKDNLIGRGLNLISKTVSIAIKALSIIQKGDKVLVVTNPPSLPIIALVLKNIKNCQFFLLVHDVYPEALIAAKILKPDTISSKIFNSINNRVCSSADKIITLGRDMQNLVAQKLLIKLSIQEKSHISIIPNWADHENIKPILKSDNSLLHKLDIDKNFVILYAGNIGRTHNIEIIVNAAQKLKEFKATQKNSSPQAISFLFIGNGAKRSWLEQEIQQNELENIHVLQYLPESERNIAVTACDVAVISFLAGMAGVSVPSRMYNQMAAGKPIIAIADSDSELAEVIKEEQIGWVVQPDNLPQLIETIQLASENPNLCKEMGVRARNAALEKYTYAKVITLYQELFA
jgi:colanic acid biosynthesis glycosyl transferase WcaI